MARPRPPRPPSVALVRPAPVVASTLAHWRDDPVVVRLTARLHAIVSDIARKSADAAIAIGSQLAEIRRRLPHGLWRRWVEDNASFGRSTADNYMKLAAWAERSPADFARLRHLGPGKLYVVAAAPPDRIRKLAPGKPVRIPGTAEKKTIEHMTAPELGAVIGDLLPPGPREPPIEEIVGHVRSRIDALSSATDTLLRRADEIDRATLKDLRTELSDVLAKIDAASRG